MSTNKDDKELLKLSGIAAADAVATGVDATLGGGAPFASGAWGLAKALLGKGLALRQKKALEWVETVRDNPSIFTKQLLDTEEFQDSFVTCLESYIKERDADKRSVLRAIFLDYSAFPNPLSYPLERLNEITKQITIKDARNFSYIVYLSTEYQPGRSIGEGTGDIESIFHLCSLGLLIQDASPRFMSEGRAGPPTPFVFVSGLGAHYYEVIKSSGLLEKEK